MLSRLIFDDAIPLERQAIVTSARATTWSGVRDCANSVLHSVEQLRGRRVGLVFAAGADSYAALAALERLSCDVFLFDATVRSEEALRLASKLRLAGLLVPPIHGECRDCELQELPAEEPGSGNSSVTILTSGSTGEPKAVRHSWETLSRPIRRYAGDRAPRWLLTYRPNLYAGLQVALQCLADRGTLMIPAVDSDPQSTAQFMSATGVEYVSATPSYWRRLLMFADPDSLARIPMVQITLGGEVVDQAVLDRLRRLFPKARLVHIYATTEMGRCFSVSDGLAGFPESYLDGPLQPDGVELRVENSELMIRSANSMRMYDPYCSHPEVADWFATGDIVEIKASRVYFAGRKSDMINVAGSKVYPIEVERVIRTVPGVSDVRVFGRASSIAGELVACEIVPDPGQDTAALQSLVARTCRDRLSSPQQPRLMKFVPRIDLSAAGKTLRARA